MSTLPFPKHLVFGAVMCEDNDGNEYPRLVGAGAVVVRRGKYGQGFDHNGPHAHVCADCGHVTYSEGRIYPVDIQRHYDDVHGYVPALLP